MVVVDIFSGAGGLSEGFHSEGFKIVAQVEKEKWACETLKTRLIFYFLKENNDLQTYFEYLRRSRGYENLDNDRGFIFDRYPELKEMIKYIILNLKFGNPANDPKSTSSKDVINLINSSLKYNNKNNVDLIIGGPPCQAYSLVGRGRMKESAKKDARNYLFYYYLSIVKEYKPNIFVFENVPGILTAKAGTVLSKIKEEFDKIGYTLLTGESTEDKNNIIDFADYGIHQSRKRVIIFGFKSVLNYRYPDFKKIRHTFNSDLVTKNVISDLPTLLPGEGNDHYLCDYESENNLSEFQQLMRKESIGILNHKARRVNDRDRKIYKIALKKALQNEKLKYSDLPNELKTHKNQNAFQDRFKVHLWDNIPHTVVAHISKDGHYNIHPDVKQLRSLTVREAARIQSFHDNYKFEGPRTAQYVQVGNAVSPLMSQIIAKTVKDYDRNNLD